MTDYEIDALVAAANPIGEQALMAYPLAGAELALRDAIVQDGDTPAALPLPSRRWLPRPRRLAASFAVAACAIAGFLALGGRDGATSGTAWAAPLVHLAESSPLLLLDQPGWTVTRADESDAVEGEMTFTHADAGGPGRTAALNWRRGSLASWQQDRAKDMALLVHHTVLGQPAQVTQYPEYQGTKDFTAIWPESSRVLEFRAVADSLAAFEQMLDSLKRVDVDTWLSAMPASVVKSANRSSVVKDMLADIPLPPGFDATSLENKPLVSDRYQLGAQVAGAVACIWIDRWAAARKRGDSAAAKAAADAMQTSHNWKILIEMQKDGAYPEVLWGYADAMRGDGLWYGRPLKGDAASGLGCDTASR